MNRMEAEKLAYLWVAARTKDEKKMGVYFAPVYKNRDWLVSKTIKGVHERWVFLPPFKNKNSGNPIKTIEAAPVYWTGSSD